MPKPFTYLLILTATISCNQPTDNREKKVKEHNSTISMYSEEIRDSFFISVNLPEGYETTHKQPYPVAYVLDANFQFDMHAVAVNKYTEMGLLPPLILVGIGYADAGAMDSLRSRDYTYPAAIPEYEMEVSGGAAKFLRFISGKLVPYIDEHYTTDTANRIILGHSLAGYFVAYAMVEDLAGEDSPFSSYIAASPSLHYNHYILMDWIKELAPSERTGGMITSYFTYGGLEDEDDSDDTSLMKNPVLVASLNQELKERRAGRLIFRTDIYSGLGHMDTPHPTFMKGLQWVTDKGN